MTETDNIGPDWGNILVSDILTQKQSITLCQTNIYRDVPELVVSALRQENFNQEKIYIGCSYVGQMEQLSQILKEYIRLKLGFVPRVLFFVSENVGMSVNTQISNENDFQDFDSVEQLYLHCGSFGISPLEFCISQLPYSTIVLFIQPLLTDPKRCCLNYYLKENDFLILCGSNLYLPESLGVHLSEQQLKDALTLIGGAYSFFGHKVELKDKFLASSDNVPTIQPGASSHRRQHLYGGAKSLINSIRQFGIEEADLQAEGGRTDRLCKNEISLRDFLRQLLLLSLSLLNELSEIQVEKLENIQKKLSNLYQHKARLLDDEKIISERLQRSAYANQDDQKHLTEIIAQRAKIEAQILDLQAEEDDRAITVVKSPYAVATRLWLKNNVDLEFMQSSTRYLNAFFDLLDSSGFIDETVENSFKNSTEVDIIGKFFNEFHQQLGFSTQSQYDDENKSTQIAEIVNSLQELQQNLYDVHLKQVLQTLEDVISICQFTDQLSTLFDPNWRYVGRHWQYAQNFYVPGTTAGRVLLTDFTAIKQQDGHNTSQFFKHQSKIIQLQVLDPLIELKEIATYSKRLVICVPFYGKTVLNEFKAFFSHFPDTVYRAFRVCNEGTIKSTLKQEQTQQNISYATRLLQVDGPILKCRKSACLMSQSTQNVQNIQSYDFPATPLLISQPDVRHYVLTTGADQSVLSFRGGVTAESSQNYVRLLQQLLGNIADGAICIFQSRKALDEFLKHTEASQQLQRVSGPKLLLISSDDGISAQNIWRGFKAACDSGRGALLLTSADEQFIYGAGLAAQRSRLIIFIGYPTLIASNSIAQAKIIDIHRQGIQVTAFLNEIVQNVISNIIQHLLPAQRAAIVYADSRFQQIFQQDIQAGDVILGTPGTERDIAAFIQAGDT